MALKHHGVLHVLILVAVFSSLSTSQTVFPNSRLVMSSLGPPTSKPTSNITKPERTYLPTTGASPDPLGINLISGFYGPGSWAGWFLAITASYVRLGTKPDAKIDPNTWLFLLGMNWAAIDLLRNIHIFWDSSRGEGETDKGLGQVAASLSFVYWGSVYTLPQFPLVLKIGEGRKKPLTQRLITLIVGLMLPASAHTAVLLSWRWPPISTGTPETFLRDVNINRIPFFYYEGRDKDMYEFAMMGALPLGCLTLGIVLIGLFSITVAHIYDRNILVRYLLDRAAKHEKAFWVTYFTLGVVFVAPLTILLFVKTSKLVWTWMLGIYAFPIVLVASSILLFFSSLGFIYLICDYFIISLIQGFKNFHKSCFFMPCAPQSITEWDQAYSLMVGLVLLFGIEIAPAVINHRKELKEFEENLRKKINDGIRRRSLGEAERQSMDITSARNHGIEGGDIEMGPLTQHDDEPDAPLEFGTPERATLYDAFAASEEEFGTFEHADVDVHVGSRRRRISGDRSRTTTADDGEIGDERYMMSGGRSGA